MGSGIPKLDLVSSLLTVGISNDLKQFILAGLVHGQVAWGIEIEIETRAIPG